MKVDALSDSEFARLKHRRRKLTRVDLMLEILETIRPTGLALTLDEIAEVCECSRMLIWIDELSAMQKMQYCARQRALAGTERMSA